MLAETLMALAALAGNTVVAAATTTHGRRPGEGSLGCWDKATQTGPPSRSGAWARRATS